MTREIETEFNSVEERLERMNMSFWGIEKELDDLDLDFGDENIGNYLMKLRDLKASVFRYLFQKYGK